LRQRFEPLDIPMEIGFLAEDIPDAVSG